MPRDKSVNGQSQHLCHNAWRKIMIERCKILAYVILHFCPESIVECTGTGLKNMLPAPGLWLLVLKRTSWLSKGLGNRFSETDFSKITEVLENMAEFHLKNSHRIDP
jgi:hypothetical protein